MPEKNSNESEPIKSEKEARWKEIEEMLEREIDVEIGIKEPCKALNAFGIPTVNSCEGHYNHGRIVPWVAIASPGEPNEKYIGQEKFEAEVYEKHGISQELLKKYKKLRDKLLNSEEYKEEVRMAIPMPALELDFTEEEGKILDEIYSRLMEKNGISREDRKKIENVERNMDKEMQEAEKTGIIKETPAYSEYKKQNVILQRKTNALLEEFYKGRIVPENVRLIVDVAGYMGTGGFFLRNDGGGDYISLEEMTEESKKKHKEIVEGKTSQEKQEMLKERIRLYRKEFNDFAEFLKKKFFEE